MGSLKALAMAYSTVDVTVGDETIRLRIPVGEEGVEYHQWLVGLSKTDDAKPIYALLFPWFKRFLIGADELTDTEIEHVLRALGVKAATQAMRDVAGLNKSADDLNA